MFRAGFSSIAFTDLTVNSACDDLFPGVEDVDAQATLQLRAALDAFDEGVYEYHSRAALAADGRSNNDAGGAKGRAPRRTRREQAYASRIPEDRQCFRPVEQQSAEWAAFKPHLWLRGRQVLPPEAHVHPHPHGPPGLHHAPPAATAAAAAAAAAARVAPQAAGPEAAPHAASPPPAAPSAAAAAADSELCLQGVSMRLERAPQGLEAHEELLAAHGDFEETFVVQHDEWEAHVPPHLRRRRGRPRDEKAVAIGLPPLEPRQAVMYDVAETLLPELWARLAPLLAPLLTQLAEERQRRPLTSTTSAFRSGGGGRGDGGGGFEILTFSSGEEDFAGGSGGGFGPGPGGDIGMGPDMVIWGGSDGAGGGEHASFYSSGVGGCGGVGGTSFGSGSRRVDSVYDTDGGESMSYDLGLLHPAAGGVGGGGGGSHTHGNPAAALRPTSPDAPSPLSRAGFRSPPPPGPPPVLPRDHWPPSDPAAPSAFAAPPPLNAPGPLVPLQRAAGPPPALTGAGSQPSAGTPPALSPLASPSQSRSTPYVPLRPSLGSCCGGSEAAAALAPTHAVGAPLAPLLQLSSGPACLSSATHGSATGSPSPSGHASPHPHPLQHSSPAPSQSRLLHHQHSPPHLFDPAPPQGAQPEQRLPPGCLLPASSSSSSSQPPQLQQLHTSGGAAEALALLALGPLRGTAAGTAVVVSPHAQQPGGPARRVPSLEARPAPGHSSSPLPPAAVVVAQGQGGPGLLEVSGMVPAGAALGGSGGSFTRMSAPGGAVSVAGSRVQPPGGGAGPGGGKATWAGGGGGGGGFGVGSGGGGGHQTPSPITSVAAAAFALHARFLGPPGVAAAAGSGVGAPAGPAAAGSYAGVVAAGGGPAAAGVGGLGGGSPTARRLGGSSSHHHLHPVHLAPLGGVAAAVGAGAGGGGSGGAGSPAAAVAGVAAASAAATAAAMAAAAAQRRQQQPVAAATVGGGGSGGPGIAMPAVGRKPSGELLPPPLSRPSLSGSQEPLQVQRRCNSITCASSAPPHKTADGSPGPAPGPANKSGAAPPLQPQPTLPPQPSPPPPPQPPASSSSGATTRLPALSLARSTTSGSAAGL